MELKSRYDVIELLGSDPISKTFIAIDREADSPQKVAIKQFKIASTIPLNIQEAIALASALNIQGFPKLLNGFADAERLYLVYEFIEGVNLKQFREIQGVFNESQIWRLLNDVLPLLERSHRAEIIHHNIKPTSIIKSDAASDRLYKILNPAPIKLLDKLGLNFLANPEYSAPEQLKGKPIFASDLYSLGVSCINLLTGIKPFDLLDASNNWIWQDYLSTKISASLERAIAKLIESDIDKRFSSVSQVIKAINTDPLSYLVAKHSNNTSKAEAIAWQCIQTLDLSRSGFGSINSIALNSSENRLAVAREDKSLQIWDLTSNSHLATLTGHNGAVTSVAFSLDGKAIASASDDKTIKIWRIENCTEVATLIGHTNRVKSVKYSPCGRFMASGSWDKTIKLWDSYTFVEIATLAAHKLQVNSVAFSPDGKFLASGSYDRNVNLWDISRRDSPKLVSTLKGHLWAVTAIAFHPTSHILASGSDDNTIKIWDSKSGQLLKTINAHSRPVSSLKFIDNGENLVSASRDAKLKLWCLESGNEIVTLSGHNDAVYCLTVSQDSKTLISGSQDETMKIWQKLQ